VTKIPKRTTEGRERRGIQRRGGQEKGEETPRNRLLSRPSSDNLIPPARSHLTFSELPEIVPTAEDIHTIILVFI
jgi:hypothetical protein